MNGIVGSSCDLHWYDILDDVKSATPKNVRIIEMFSKDSSTVSINGQATSYEAVHLFVKMLNKSESIDSASLVDAEKSKEYGGLAKYLITCSLFQGGGS